jgi:hypothetical protein
MRIESKHHNNISGPPIKALEPPALRARSVDGKTISIIKGKLAGWTSRYRIEEF